MSRLQQLALTLLPGIGPVLARKLLEHYGNEAAVFAESAGDLVKIPGIGAKLARSFRPACCEKAYRQAEAELKLMQQAGIKPLFYLDREYPRRLKECYDAPVFIGYKGTAAINHPRVLSVVGSRRATPRGKLLCASLIEGLRQYDPMIVSGLAYGIDVAAHRAALKNGLPTLGVLGHGIGTMYPAAHYPVSREIAVGGGLLSEFLYHTPPAPENFPKRNRVVAGLADATIVVEASKKGGALITAGIALSYNREVFAFPGRVSDENSAGCLRLIGNHRAQLITGAADLAWHLGWEPAGRPAANAALHDDGFASRAHSAEKFTDDEAEIMKEIRKHDGISVDKLVNEGRFNRESLIYSLFNLELSGLVVNIPGKGYFYK